MSDNPLKVFLDRISETERELKRCIGRPLDMDAFNKKMLEAEQKIPLKLISEMTKEEFEALFLTRRTSTINSNDDEQSPS